MVERTEAFTQDTHGETFNRIEKNGGISSFGNGSSTKEKELSFIDLQVELKKNDIDLLKIPLIHVQKGRCIPHRIINSMEVGYIEDSHEKVFQENKRNGITPQDILRFKFGYFIGRLKATIHRITSLY